MKKCNVEVYDEGLRMCGTQAEWKHPRYPDGLFCDEHKKMTEFFFKDGWEKIIIERSKLCI